MPLCGFLRRLEKHFHNHHQRHLDIFAVCRAFTNGRGQVYCNLQLCSKTAALSIGTETTSLLMLGAQ